MHHATEHWHSLKREVSNEQFSPAKIFSPTFRQFPGISPTVTKFPTISRLSRQVVTVQNKSPGYHTRYNITQRRNTHSNRH